MIGKKDVNFRYKQLYHGEENTGWSVVEDKTFLTMWRVRWPDGVLSEDYYNYTRARDHAARLYSDEQNKAPRSLAGEFK